MNKILCCSLSLACLVTTAGCGFIGYDPRPQENSLAAATDPLAGVDANTAAAVESAASIPGNQRAFSAPGRPTSPVLLYLFDEGQGPVVLDRSGVDPAYDLAVIEVDGSSFTWQSGSLNLGRDAVAKALSPATKLVQALSAAQAASFEFWFEVSTPERQTLDNTTFMALGSSSTQGDMLWHIFSGMEGSPLKVRHMLRHASGNPSGTPNQWGGTVGHPLVEGQAHHVVITHAVSGDRILYLNGVAVSSCNDACDVQATVYNVAPRYDLWQDTYALHIGNEPGLEAGWGGTLHLVAFYDRALSASEISDAFTAGPNPEL